MMGIERRRKRINQLVNIIQSKEIAELEFQSEGGVKNPARAPPYLIYKTPSESRFTEEFVESVNSHAIREGLNARLEMSYKEILQHKDRIKLRIAYLPRENSKFDQEQSTDHLLGIAINYLKSI